MRSVVKWLLYQVYERRLAKKIARGPFPQHLGVILDGNRRFAKSLGLAASEGHRLGAQKIKSLLTWCEEFHIPVVTLWVFSTQNFSRDPEEVKALMVLFKEQAKEMLEDKDAEARGMRVRVLGRKEDLPDDVKVALDDLERGTADRKGMLVQLALGYGGREEIVDAVKAYMLESEQEGKSIHAAAEAVTEQSLAAHLYNGNVADPDFIIRTSGEIRLSGFLLWQSAYSEYYFLDVNWPGFRKVDFLRALRSFQLRQRRFGK